MSYGVKLTVQYKETITQEGTTKETTYFFHVDAPHQVSELITQTAQNAKNMNAKVSEVGVTDETSNTYRNLSDSEILDLLLTK